MDNQQGASAQQGQLPLEQQQPYKGLVRPQQIQNFSFLEPAKKQSYQTGISTLWQSIHNNPQDSDDHKKALQRLIQISRALVNDLRKHQASQATGQAAGQAASASQPASRPSSQGQAPAQQQQQQAQTQQPNTQANVPPSGASQNQPPAAAAPRQGQQTVQQPGQQPRAGTGAESETPERYLKQVDGMSWTTFPKPPQGTPETYLAEVKRRYAAALFRKDTHQAMLQKIAAQEQQLQQAGQQVPAAVAGNKSKNQAALQTAINFIEAINKQQRELKTPANGAQRPAAGQTQTGGAAQSQMPAQVAGQQRPQMPQGNQGQPQPGTGGQANTAAPVSGGVNQMPGNNQPRLPQANGAQIGQGQPNFNAPRPLPGPTGQSYSGGQTQSPQTTMPPQGPVPYSHQSAINAARSHSNPQISQPNSARPEGQNAFGRAEAGERQTKPTYGSMKGWVPQAPQPVPMGAARPTLTGSSNGMSGMMGQPAIAQKPEFSLHGQGDRVLDKKKLDELVRQVAGAGGREHQSLQPDVEESMLSLADEFVDNVITSACRLAKARGSGQLELRDLQVVIERYYNIRIPGYALDDNRTVRKVQPSPTYLQKMNAVQAAKVMGGKTDI